MRLLRSRKFWLILLVSLGLAWRLGRYFLNFPIWGDEAAVGLNILDRSYLGLLRPLNYVVACPVGFLSISKWMMARPYNDCTWPPTGQHQATRRAPDAEATW